MYALENLCSLFKYEERQLKAERENERKIVAADFPYSVELGHEMVWLEGVL